MTAAPRPLWRDRDFATLWAGQTVSLLGSQVTAFALPLAAALSLGASAAQMGLLTAAEFAPSVALGLVAGVWIDRRWALRLRKELSCRSAAPRTRPVLTAR